MITSLTNSKYLAYSAFFVLVLFLSVFFYQDTISEFPRGVHAWTQSDRYAISLKFLENGFDFFHPATYNLKGKNGITQVDFPIHEYIIAVAMKVLGTTDPVVFRMYTLLYSIIGLFFLFKLTHQVTHSYFKSLLMVAFVFTLPVYCYYQSGFIPSVPSFANTIIACYCLYRYSSEKQIRLFITAVFFFTLSGLSRLPFSLFLLALFIEKIIGFIKGKQALKKEILVCFIGITAIGVYYLYNRYLAREYGSIFWMSPLYIFNMEMFWEIMRAFRGRWLTEYFTVYHYMFFAIALATIIMNRKHVAAFIRSEKTFFIWYLISFAGSIAYFFVNGQQFIDHDYYFIDSFLLLFLLLFLFGLRFIEVEKRVLKYLTGVLFSGLTIGAMYKCQASQESRYSVPSYDQVEQARQSFVGSGEYLDSLGIPRSATLLVLQANTYNTPFIYMKRNGYTVLVLRNGDFHSEVMKREYDYVIIPNRFILSEVIPYAPSLINELSFVASNGKISVYTYSPKKINNTITEFLGIKSNNIQLNTKLSFDSVQTYEHWDRYNTRDSLHAFSKEYSLKQEPSQEFGIIYSTTMNELKLGKSVQVMIKTKVRVPFSKNINIVAALDNSQDNYFYDSFSLQKQDYIQPGEAWQTIICQFILPEDIKKEDKLSVYFWNPDKITFWLDDLEFLVYSY